MLGGGHRQTLAGHFARSRARWRRATEDVVIDAADDVRLLLRVSWHDGPRAERPAVVLLHGLEGCDYSGYVLSAAEVAFRTGYHVIRMNFRGCGDALRVCPLLYNAGVSRDLLAVLDWVSSEVRQAAVVGFSLGGNLTLLALARHRAALPGGVAAAVAVSPPLDLAAAADALERPRNTIYRHYFLRRLRASYRRRQSLLPELYDRGMERKCRSLWEYDDIITARYAGYRGARDYYTQSSAGPVLMDIDRPALIISASDDPLIPTDSIARWPMAPAVRRELTETGGHVGFVGRSLAPGLFWAAERAISFVDECLGR
jgi:predicted alpha/beta-fold hydrolase